MQIIYLITVAMVPAFCLATVKYQEKPSAIVHVESPIKLSLNSDKSKYKRNDEIGLNAMVMNQSLREIFIYGSLEWGYHASLTLCVQDAKGKEVSPNFIADAITHFEDPNDTSQFVKLLPFHFFGKDAQHITQSAKHPETR